MSPKKLKKQRESYELALKKFRVLTDEELKNLFRKERSPERFIRQSA